MPGYHPEHCLLGGVAIAAGLCRAVRGAVPSVREVAVGVGGAGRLHAVVSLTAPRAGEARKAMFAVELAQAGMTGPRRCSKAATVFSTASTASRFGCRGSAANRSE